MAEYETDAFASEGQIGLMTEAAVDKELRPLVLLHGMMGNITNWRATLQHFRGRYHLAPVEFPLYDANAPFYTVPTLTDYVCRRLDEDGIRRAVFFGNSMGGHVALHMALRHPDRVDGLVLTGSAGLLERSIVNGQTPMKPSREWIRTHAQEVFFDPAQATDEIVDEVSSILSTNRNKLRLVKLARAMRRDNMLESLPSIQAPTLLVWGRQDIITPLSVARQFAEHMPNARLHVIDRCGHAPNIEQPAAFNRLAEAFLEEIGYR